MSLLRPDATDNGQRLAGLVKELAFQLHSKPSTLHIERTDWMALRRWVRETEGLEVSEVDLLNMTAGYASLWEMRVVFDAGPGSPRVE